MSNRPYYQQIDIENTKKLRELISDLPAFVGDFFRGIGYQTSSRTQIAYAYDLRVFFHFLCEHNPLIKQEELKTLPVSTLDEIRALDLEEYVEHLRYYSSGEDNEKSNKERGIMRKISSLKTFYNYFFRLEIIHTNPAALITLPRLHDKEIIRLEPDEVALLLDAVESGDKLSKNQQAFHSKTKARDLAILTLLLGTGIRVSECVGIDITDVDFKNSALKVHRKGGKEVVLYFGDEVEKALQDYLAERKEIQAVPGHENAFFLSLQKKRMGVRSVENLVKKYTKSVTPLKNITPHKLRSTYGTSLYRETGDIYLVADVLGHNDVNTTKKHYAAIEENRRRAARNVVSLRENEQ